VLGNDNSPALFKIDIKNAFNECNRTSFLDRVSEDFPEIAPWVHWCYSQPAELHTSETYSGIYRCSAGDLLDPLLFSLVLVQFLNPNPLDEACLLSLWYLDDGFFIVSRSSLHTLLSYFYKFGPHVGLNAWMFDFMYCLIILPQLFQIIKIPLYKICRAM